MNFVYIEKKEWNKLLQAIDSMQEQISSLMKQNEEKVIPRENGFITVKEAMHKYNRSRTALNKKAKKYNVSRLPMGRENLLNEKELIEALKQREPVPKAFKK